MAPGPVQYKRKYTLWILILLIIVCWPVAIIYYFTRDKVPVVEYQTYVTPPGAMAPPPSTPMAPAAGTRYCSHCGTPNPANATTCSKCGAPLS